MTDQEKIKKIKKLISEAAHIYATIENNDFELYIKLFSLDQDFGRIALKMTKESIKEGKA